MASLVTQMLVAERYGLRLGMEQLAEVLGIKKPSLYNAISNGACPVPTYIDQGRRWADYRSVAEHLDKCHSLASGGAA